MIWDASRDVYKAAKKESIAHLQQSGISLPMNSNARIIHQIKYLHCLSQSTSLAQTIKNIIRLACVFNFSNLSTLIFSEHLVCVCRRYAKFSAPWQRYRRAPAPFKNHDLTYEYNKQVLRLKSHLKAGLLWARWWTEPHACVVASSDGQNPNEAGVHHFGTPPAAHILSWLRTNQM